MTVVFVSAEDSGRGKRRNADGVNTTGANQEGALTCTPSTAAPPILILSTKSLMC